MPTKSLVRQHFSSWINFWGQKPERKLWIVLPVCYMLFLQLITGMPKPEALKRMDGNELLTRFSEELFDYPYWLQDLSHLPLFFVLAWLWSWYLGPVGRIGLIWKNKALFFSLAYGCINELTQAFIPERFPSFGDLAMNTIGVSLGIVAHSKLSKVLEDTRETAPKD